MLIDLVMQRDRQYFRTNPDKVSYIREYIDGELGDVSELKISNPRYVLITKITDDLRTRIIIGYKNEL